MNEKEIKTAKNMLSGESIGEIKSAYSISPEAFANPKVKRGLREIDGTGVMAGVTNIGNAHGYIIYEGEKVADKGQLFYRGYDMAELVDSYAVNNDIARIYGPYARDRVEHRGFSCPVTSDNGNEVSLVKMQIYSAKSLLFINRSGIKGLLDVFQLKHVFLRSIRLDE